MDTQDKVIENTAILLDATIRDFVNKHHNKKTNHSTYCIVCEEEIDKRRIIVYPQAVRCIECECEYEAEINFTKKVLHNRGVIQNM